MKEKADQIQLKSASRKIAMIVQRLKGILFVVALALLVPCHGFGAQSWWEVPPPGQPAQMWSKVDYDPQAPDPLFESNEWSFPRWFREDPGGHSSTRTAHGKGPAHVPPRSKYTAKCFSNSFNVWHPVKFCEARLLDGNVMELLIHESNPAFRDALRVRIRNGQFTCQYRGLEGIRTFRWTSKRQKLILDKKEYAEGDTIKGRIDFECLMNVIDPKNIERWGKDPTTTIQIFGVFKTMVE